MKNNRSNFFKLCAVTLALAVFAAGLTISRGGPGAQVASAASTAQTETADAGDGSPRVEELAASPLEAETAEGNARLLVRFAADQKVGTEVKAVIDDRDVILRDDGAGGDERAGDGTHSAIVFIDFNSLADNQDEIQSINSKPEPTPTPEEQVEPTEPTTGVDSAQTAAAASATTAEQPTLTDEERADTSLASGDSILVPDFRSSPRPTTCRTRGSARFSSAVRRSRRATRSRPWT